MLLEDRSKFLSFEPWPCVYRSPTLELDFCVSPVRSVQSRMKDYLDINACMSGSTVLRCANLS